MKVLIIDDENALLDMYKEKLTFEGFEVITAPDGEKGLARAEKEKPDAILLDLIMPNMNGFDVLKSLRANITTKHTPVYLLTNIPEETTGSKGRQLGANGYLFKAETEPKKLAAVMKELRKKLKKEHQIEE